MQLTAGLFVVSKHDESLMVNQCHGIFHNFNLDFHGKLDTLISDVSEHAWMDLVTICMDGMVHRMCGAISSYTSTLWSLHSNCVHE